MTRVMRSRGLSPVASSCMHTAGLTASWHDSIWGTQDQHGQGSTAQGQLVIQAMHAFQLLCCQHRQTQISTCQTQAHPEDNTKGVYVSLQADGTAQQYLWCCLHIWQPVTGHASWSDL